MSLTMHIYNNENSEGFDVSEIVHSIEYTTSILGQAGKLTFTLEKDPNNILKIGVGSLVKFWHSDSNTEEEKPIFMGNIFTIGTTEKNDYRVVAYDQLRYLQNHNNLVIPDYEDELVYYFTLICEQEGLKPEQWKVGNWVKYIGTHTPIAGNNFVDCSNFDILQYCMNEYSLHCNLRIKTENITPEFMASGGKILRKDLYVPKFYLKDNFGVLELREVLTDFIYDDYGNEKKEFLVIGDESLLTSYNYEVDIDKDTSNEFFFMYNQKKDGANESTETNKLVNEKSLLVSFQAGVPIKGTNTKLDGQTIGNDTIPKWGRLRRFVTLNTSKINSEVKLYMEQLVSIYNQPTRKMKINAIGLDGVDAGSSFVLKLDKLGINYSTYVISATHRYDADHHTMELDVNSNPASVGGLE